MLMLQTLKMPFRRASRAFGSSILWNRPVSHRFQYRAYAKESNCKDGRLTRNILEEEESSSSQSCGSYIVPAALVVFIGAGAFIHYNDEKRAIPKGSERSTGIGKADTNKPAIGGPFKLFDTENHLVTESNLRGNWILLYFGYTSSPDVGPAEVDKMAKAIDILEIDPRIKGLTGPISSVRQIAQEYRVFFKKVDEEGQDYLVESSHNMYLLDPNMDTVRWFGAEYDASQLADGILAEVISRKRMNLILKPQSYSRFMREGITLYSEYICNYNN
ncbi:protein SCO1 homolog 2, mitochondrial isoform X7 [Phalaenopsis equestris]|uniref:protein SCO1 homolog 2, mitochondrial isoform X7 n=1 Tax=Phalaenopsis equestris TaxID=78828 RepID=UPI0009E534C4|nr:protein SCO1 homolog 2, mitochondrial isoform X7 [Phalaenopsis equestris]